MSGGKKIVKKSCLFSFKCSATQLEFVWVWRYNLMF